MKRNVRRSKKMSVMTANACHFGSIIVALFVMVILNVMASSSCQQLMKSIGEADKELARLNEAYERESSHWNKMKTPEKLEQALMRHGLSMKPPHAYQNVYMNGDGTPVSGQPSVSAANRRRKIPAAQYQPQRRAR